MKRSAVHSFARRSRSPRRSPRRPSPHYSPRRMSRRSPGRRSRSPNLSRRSFHERSPVRTRNEAFHERPKEMFDKSHLRTSSKHVHSRGHSLSPARKLTSRKISPDSRKPSLMEDDRRALSPRSHRKHSPLRRDRGSPPRRLDIAVHRETRPHDAGDMMLVNSGPHLVPSVEQLGSGGLRSIDPHLKETDIYRPKGQGFDERYPEIENFHRHTGEGHVYPPESKQPLDKRFKGTGHLPAFDPEDLKKITVDIRRNIPRDIEPVVRHILRPEDVVIVRRPTEGVRPMFERDELKQAIAQRRDEECLEKRVVAIMRDKSRSLSPDRHGYNVPAAHAEKMRRDSRSPVSHRPDEYRTRHSSGDYEDRRGARPQYRSEANGSRETHFRSRSSERRPPTDPNDLRHNLMGRGHLSGISDARHRIEDRRERDNDSGARFDPRSPERKRSFPGDRFKRGGFSGPDRNRPGDNDRFRGPHGDNLPNFSTRPDRYQYKEWLDKPDMVPKGPSYFEHDNRGDGDSFRRGIGRSRGFVRGSGRFFRGRAPFRGRVGGFRGTFIRGRGKPSPHQWEHDMFEKVSPASKSFLHK